MKKKSWSVIAFAVILIGALVAGIILDRRSRIADIIDDEARFDRMDHAVRPVPVNIDVNNLKDGVYPVAFKQEEVEKADGGFNIPFEVFNMDLYDGVELHNLNAGDYIEVAGELMKVDSLSFESRIRINGGLDCGGVEFRSVGGGVYRYDGWDDMPTYTSFGKVKLFVPDTIIFTDKGNVSESMAGVVVPAGKVYEYLRTVEFGYFNEYAVNIRIEDGKVVEFWRNYRP